MKECIIIALGVLADQYSKMWVSKNLVGLVAEVIPGVLSYSYVENTGAAFGMLGKGTLLLSIFSGLMVAVLGLILARCKKVFSQLTNVAMAMIISGAVGNFIDRVFLGYVVDFINVDFTVFAVFNVADIFITTGTVLLILSLLFIESKNEAQLDGVLRFGKGQEIKK